MALTLELRHLSSSCGPIVNLIVNRPSDAMRHLTRLRTTPKSLKQCHPMGAASFDKVLYLTDFKG